MTNVNAKENMSRKKYLAPVVVLLLCLVSLAGAAYAYTSSVTTNGTATANAFYVELYNDSEQTYTKPVPIDDADVVTFTTDMDYVANTAVVKATPDNKDVATVYLKVKSTVPGQEDAKIKFESSLVTLGDDVLCKGMTLQASVSSVTQGGAPITAVGGYYTVAIDSTVIMTLALEVGGDLEWDVTDEGYASAEAAATAFQDAFEQNAKFKFTITAENIVTP